MALPATALHRAGFRILLIAAPEAGERLVKGEQP
jgi:hypothetical protein